MGLELYQAAPDHSTLSKFHGRLKVEGFYALFNRVVEFARHKGLIADEPRIVDSTHQTANVDVKRASQRKPQEEDNDGHKHHTGVDDKHGIITNSAASPGHMHDGDYPDDLCSGMKLKALTADKIYDAEHQHDRVNEAGIESLIIRKNDDDKLDDPEYTKMINKRKQVERVFAVQKRNHGGERARYWGKAKMTIQNLITDMVYNFKIMGQVLPLPAR